MSFAIVASGQGNHTPDMLDFALAHAAGQQVIQVFSETFGWDLPAVARDGNDGRNALAQPLTVATAVANWSVLGPLLPAPSCFAGYSAGEVAAWACAGTWDLQTTAQVCLQRTSLMDAHAPPGCGMLAVRGLPLAAIERAATKVEIAIVNEDDHAVLAGSVDALKECEQTLLAQGAWTRLLDVSLPSHTHYMRPAADAFLGWLQTQPKTAPSVPVLLGLDGRPCRDPDAGLVALATAIRQTIRWQAVMAQLEELGTKVVLEIGPGRSLSTMLAKAHPAISARAVCDFRSPQGVVAWVERQMA